MARVQKTATKTASSIPVTYDPKKIEPILQKKWEKEKPFKALASGKTKKKAFYVLCMFPYPSGVGLHVGHPRSYLATDILARKKRMEGFNVLNPMGYDAFGLPAEQFAVQNKVHPKKAVAMNVATFEKQLKKLGFSFDWDRKVNTTDEEYYKWTQWIFLKLYNSYYDTTKQKALPIDGLVKIFEKSGNENLSAFVSDKVLRFDKNEWKKMSPLEKQEMLMKYRLAYEGVAQVNWCEALGTVLANDEIVDGKDGPVSERGGYPVTKKNIRQWFLRITAYADRLLSGLDTIAWPNHVKEIEKNWIGKSEGAEIVFTLHVPGQPEGKHEVTVFTTRPDTLFGATFLAVSAELAQTWLNVGWQTTADVKEYIENVIKDHEKSDFDASKDKTGVFTRIFATHPGTQEKIPVWVANYVLPGYGTGAIMGVPAHDERDFEFAQKYNLPITNVIDPVFIRADVKDATNFTPKNKIVAFVEAPDGKVLTINWGPELGGRLLVGGTIEDGEQPGETALRELQEETGYCNGEVVSIGEEIFDYKYFATSKNTAHQAFTRFVHIKLKDLESKGDALEDNEKGKFKVEWISKEQAKKEIVEVLHVYALEKFGYNVPFSGEGVVARSGVFSGLTSAQAKKEITKSVGGKLVTRYKMRDAIFARQRYWGEPIPLYKDKEGLIHEVKKLPLTLPNVASYEPTGTGEGPLANIASWKKAGYESNTMPGWAGSSWYYLRYMDVQNKKVFADPKEIKYWNQVNVYLGGAEHATGHLLYARFWHKLLRDYGLVPTEEPFKQFVTHGMILASDGRKMSKRWGNVVNPDDVIATYGADTERLYTAFMGPYGESIPWSEESIIGCRRFIERLYKKAQVVLSEKVLKSDTVAEKAIHKLIDKVTKDIESYSFNTAVAKAMETMNVIDSCKVSAKDFSLMLQILNPFIPHVTEYLFKECGNKEGIHTSSWPKANKKLLVDDEITIGVQINGKLRGAVTVPTNSLEDVVKKAALNENNVLKYLDGKEIIKVVYVPNRIINIVIKA